MFSIKHYSAPLILSKLHVLREILAHTLIPSQLYIFSGYIYCMRDNHQYQLTTFASIKTLQGGLEFGHISICP